MGWEKGGRYYTRSRKVNGRVVREYVGKGRMGTLAAQIDELRRMELAEKRAAEKAEIERQETIARQIVELCEQVDLLARAALVAAGYRQHNRGEWRRKREH